MKLIIAAMTVILIAFGAASFAADKADNARSAKPMQLAQASQKEQQIDQAIHSYLIKNPEVIVEALQAYQQKQMSQVKKSMQKTQDIAPKFAHVLFSKAGDPAAGNPAGKVTMVEFFDYQCSHCIEMTGVIEALVKGNPELRVVFKDFPIRGPLSELAAKASLAANYQGKYFEFHKALMQAASNLTEDKIYTIAGSVGLDVNKLKTDMKSSAVEQQIKSNYKLAQELGLMGTPALFIAKSTITQDAPASEISFVPGQVGQGQLQALINKANK